MRDERAVSFQDSRQLGNGPSPSQQSTLVQLHCLLLLIRNVGLQGKAVWCSFKIKEFKRVLKKKGKLVIVNMTVGENFGSKIYDFLYRLSPKMMGGCRGIRLSKKLQDHGFDVKLREYYQQLLFPSEVILARKWS